MNILVSPGVSSSDKITVDLRDKTLDEILGVISKLSNVLVRREKDIIFITTSAEQAAIEEDDLPVRVYHLNYVKSKDVVEIIKPLLSKSGTYSMSPESETGYPNNFVALRARAGAAAGAAAATPRPAETPWPAVKSLSFRTTNTC